MAVLLTIQKKRVMCNKPRIITPSPPQARHESIRSPVFTPLRRNHPQNLRRFRKTKGWGFRGKSENLRDFKSVIWFFFFFFIFFFILLRKTRMSVWGGIGFKSLQTDLVEIFCCTCVCGGVLFRNAMLKSYWELIRTTLYPPFLHHLSSLSIVEYESDNWGKWKNIVLREMWYSWANCCVALHVVDQIAWVRYF